MVIGCFPPSRIEQNFVFPDVSEQRIHHDARATPRSLSPKHPKSSPLLCATRGHYFTQMSVVIDPNIPNPQWIIPEDVNINVEQNCGDIWRACQFHGTPYPHHPVAMGSRDVPPIRAENRGRITGLIGKFRNPRSKTLQRDGWRRDLRVLQTWEIETKFVRNAFRGHAY